MALLARYLELSVVGLRERIGIPATLAEIGVLTTHIERLAPMARIDPSSVTNPVVLTTENLSELYARCIDRRLTEG